MLTKENGISIHLDRLVLQYVVFGIYLLSQNISCFSCVIKCHQGYLLYGFMTLSSEAEIMVRKLCIKEMNVRETKQLW